MKLIISNKTPQELEARGYVKSYDHYMHILGKYYDNDRRIVGLKPEEDGDDYVDKLYNASFDIVYLNNCYCTTKAGAEMDQTVLKNAKKLFEDCKRYKNNKTIRNLIMVAARYVSLEYSILKLGIAEEV